jgi:WD40 repeat protein
MNLTKAWVAQLDDYVIDLAWSPDGRLLAAASAAGPLNLFDGANGAKLHELPGHQDGTNCLAWGPCVIAESGTPKPDCFIPNSAVEAESACWRSPLQGAEVSTVEFGFILASGGQDGHVRFWDSIKGTQTAETDTGRGAWVEHLQWRPAAENLRTHAPYPNTLAAGAGRKLLFLNPDGALIHAFEESPKTISALAWHPGGGAIAAASFGRVVIWDADDFRIQREFAYGGAVEKLLWSPDGRWLVAGAQNNAVHLWIPGEEQEFHMSGYETKVRELSFSSDNRWLATGGSRDGCIWDCTGAGPEGREPVALPHGDRVCAVAFQHTHDLLATAANNGEVGLWRLTNGETRVAAVKLTAPPSHLAWSPADSMLAIGSQKGGVLVLAVAN